MGTVPVFHSQRLRERAAGRARVRRDGRYAVQRDRGRAARSLDRRVGGAGAAPRRHARRLHAGQSLPHAAARRLRSAARTPGSARQPHAWQGGAGARRHARLSRRRAALGRAPAGSLGLADRELGTRRARRNGRALQRTTLSIVTATPFASFATGGLAPCRSPGAGFGLPHFETRALPTTRGCADTVMPLAMAIESFSANCSGRSAARARITASGIAGPSAARAKTYTVSSGFTSLASAGASRTVPRTPGCALGTWGDEAPMPASFLASATFSAMLRASSESGGTSGSMRLQRSA